MCRRGLRKGDPLSPLIFILVVARLHNMIDKYRGVGLIEGLGCRDNTNAIINLYYADDTLIFLERMPSTGNVA